MKALFGRTEPLVDQGEQTTRVVIGIIVLGICFCLLYPFIYVLSASISDPDAVERNMVVFSPIGPINFEAYKMILHEERIWTGYFNTIFYTVVGVTINLIITVLAAYPMSRKEFRGRKFMNIFISITMFISATGLLIPLFLIVRGLGMLNTRWSVLIVFAAFPYYIILMRSFFQTIPESLVEAARIDGLSEWGILLKIMLPLSGAALATIGLYYGVNRWNGYFWAMIFMKDENKMPLQVILRELIVLAQMGEEMDADLSRSNTTAVSIQYATIVVSTLPMLIVYPFIQKYFVKGVTLGSVKG